MPSAQNRTAFVGRHRELEQLGRALDGPGLTTLVGPGGVGKTRLAREATLQTDLVCVWLDELGPQDDVAAHVARALGISDASPDDALRRAAAQLQERPDTLLLMDNAEHVIADVRSFIQQLPATARMLVTSREAVGVPGEQLIRVDPLPLADATELFRARARALAIDVTGGDELVEAVDRLPLAIELAAVRAIVLSPAQIVAELEESNAILASRDTTRHGTLDRTIAWSWKLLTADERRVLATISWFDQPTNPTFVRELWPEFDVYDVAQELEAKSLLRVVDVGGARAWDALSTIRRFVQSVASDSLEEERCARLLTWARAHQTQTARWWVPHVSAALLATKELVRAREFGVAAHIARSSFFGAYGTREYIDVVQTASRLLEAWTDPEDVDAWSSLATAVARTGIDAQASLRWARRAMSAARPGTAAWFAAAARHVRALVDVGSVDAALALLDTLAPTLGEFPPDTEGATAAVELSGAARRLGRVDEARMASERLRAIGDACGNPDIQAHGWFQLGALSYDAGEFERAAMELSQLESLLEPDARSDPRSLLNEVTFPLTELQLGNREVAHAMLIARTENLPGMRGCESIELIGCLAWAEFSAREDPDAVPAHLNRAARLARITSSSLDAVYVALWGVLHNVTYGELEEALAALPSLRSVESIADPARWNDLLDAIEWFCGDRATPPRSGDFERLFSALAQCSTTMNDEPLQQVLRDIPPTRWTIPGLDCLRIDDHVRRAAERLLQTPASQRLVIQRDGQRFCLDGADPRDLSRRGPMRRIVLELARRRAASADRLLSADDAIEVGWPDEEILYDAALMRVYTTIKRLRALGFDDALVTTDDGYTFARSLVVEWVDEVWD